MAKYGVRLSKERDPTQLLGSGTLIIQQRRAFLLTCAHVVKGLGDEERFRVEYCANQDGTGATISCCKKCFSKCGRGAFDTPNPELPIGEDYVCYPLPWEFWMDRLPDTQWAQPKPLQALAGFGFPERRNRAYREQAAPTGGGTTLNVEVSNDTPNTGYFYCRFLDQAVSGLDNELLGFSGTGLFNQSGRLVGIVKGRDLARDAEDQYEFAAIAAPKLLQFLNQAYSPEKSWEKAGLARWLSNPLAGGGSGTNTLAMAVKMVNLWSLLLVLREPVAIILLNRSGSMKAALGKIDWLDAHWTSCPTGGGEPAFPSGQGIVCTVLYSGLNRAQEILKNWRLSNSGMPILLHIDLTEDTAYHPGLTEQAFCARLAGGKKYLLLASEDYFAPSLLSADHEISGAEIEESFHRHQFSNALYDDLMGCVQRHPLDMAFLLDKLKLLAGNGSRQQKTALCRLALLYQKLTGEDISGFVRESCQDALPFLSGSEKIGLLWHVPSIGCTDWDEETDFLCENICRLQKRFQEKDWVGLADFLLEHDMAYLEKAVEWFDKQPQEDFDGLCEALSQVLGGMQYELVLCLRGRWGAARLRAIAQEPRYHALVSALSHIMPSTGDAALDQMAAYVWQSVVL